MDNDREQLKASEEIYSTFIGPKATKPLNLSMDWQEDLVQHNININANININVNTNCNCNRNN